MLKAFGFLLRLYSYLFHLALSLFLLGIAIVAATSRQPLNLRMLPFSEGQMVRGVLGLGLAGLVCTLLAITRVFKYLFPLWAGYALYILIAGFFFSPYSFPNEGTFKTALWLILAAIAAFIGALWTLRPKRGRLYS